MSLHPPPLLRLWLGRFDNELPNGFKKKLISPNKKRVDLDFFGNFFTTTCLFLISKKKWVNLTHSASLHLFHLQATPVIPVNYVFWVVVNERLRKTTQKRRGLGFPSLASPPPASMRSSGSNSPDSINSIKVRSWRETVWSWPGWRPSIPFQVAKTVSFMLVSQRVIPASHKKNWVWVWLTIGCSSRSSFGEFSVTFSLLNHNYGWMWKALCARPTTQPMHSGLLRLVVY